MVSQRCSEHLSKQQGFTSFCLCPFKVAILKRVLHIIHKDFVKQFFHKIGILFQKELLLDYDQYLSPYQTTEKQNHMLLSFTKCTF